MALIQTIEIARIDPATRARAVVSRSTRPTTFVSVAALCHGKQETHRESFERLPNGYRRVTREPSWGYLNETVVTLGGKS